MCTLPLGVNPERDDGAGLVLEHLRPGYRWPVAVSNTSTVPLA